MFHQIILHSSNIMNHCWNCHYITLLLEKKSCQRGWKWKVTMNIRPWDHYNHRDLSPWMNKCDLLMLKQSGHNVLCEKKMKFWPEGGARVQLFERHKDKRQRFSTYFSCGPLKRIDDSKRSFIITTGLQRPDKRKNPVF